MLLVVEDDPMLGPAVVEGLASHFRVELVTTLEDARATIAALECELVVLDLSLPDGSGLDLLREIRAVHRPTGVVILTALDRPQDRVAGLSLGADDYVGKPFDLEELQARCLAVARRIRGHPAPVIRLGPLAFDSVGRSVTIDDLPITLSATEFRLLDVLVASRGRIVSKDQIEERLYTWNEEIESNTVEVYVSRLRRKLGYPMIRTVRGLGYMLAAPE